MAPRSVIFVGPSLEDLRRFPEGVKDAIGYALWLAQIGRKHPDAKPMHGFGGAGVLEIVEVFDRNAYRAIYAVKFGTAIYVLHAFQKKSTRGIATPKHDIDLIRQRLREAETIHAARGGS
jgi:phage-related protein